VVATERRIPRQGRAEATVQAILEASFQILEAEGREKLTTNHIARRAGVSVGTLYQYFDDKDAILAAIARSKIDAVYGTVRASLGSPPYRNAVRPVVRTLMGAFGGSRHVRAALLDALIASGDERVITDHYRSIARTLREGNPDAELAPEIAFVLTHAIPGLLRAAAVETAAELDASTLEDELVLLIDSYIAALVARDRL